MPEFGEYIVTHAERKFNSKILSFEFFVILHKYMYVHLCNISNLHGFYVALR